MVARHDSPAQNTPKSLQTGGRDGPWRSSLPMPSAGYPPSPSEWGIKTAPSGALSPCPALDTTESLCVGDRDGPWGNSLHAQRRIPPNPSNWGIGMASGGVLSPCVAPDTPKSLRVGG